MILELRLFADEGDVGVRKDAFYTLTELRYYGSHAFASFIESRTMDIGFRGDATHIQTRTSHVVAFENHDLEALLGGIFRSAIAPWASSDDNEISFIH